MSRTCGRARSSIVAGARSLQRSTMLLRARSLFAGAALLAVSSLVPVACGGSSGDVESQSKPGLGLVAFEKDVGIYLAEPDGSGARRLTRGKADTAPRWAPDGREIAFLGKRDGQWDLYVIRPDGTGERRLTRTEAEEQDVEWAPNGLRLALLTKKGSEYVVELVGRGGGTPRVVASRVAGDDRPEWSPDSRRLAVVRGGTITIVDPDRNTARELVRGSTPSWAPDGERMAFTRGSQVFDVDVDGSGERALGPEEGISAVPKLSPDGERIAFETIGGALDMLSAVVGIGMATAEGEDFEIVATDAADAPPVWSPDGSTLLYIRTVDDKGFVNYDVCSIRLEDGRITVIAGSDEPEYVGPAAWQPLPSPES